MTTVNKVIILKSDLGEEVISMGDMEQVSIAEIFFRIGYALRNSNVSLREVSSVIITEGISYSEFQIDARAENFITAALKHAAD